MIALIVLIIIVVSVSGVYLFTRSTTPMPTTPMPTTRMPTTPIPTTPMPTTPVPTTPVPTTPVPTTPVPTTPAPTTPPPPVDCQVSEWSEWSKCTKECGGGTQTQTRTVKVQPQNGGKECPSLSHTRACNEKECPVCTYLDWLKCDCLTKEQTRTLDPSSPSYCIPAETTRSCTPDADCDWYGFNNSYISDGEYIARDYKPDFKSCYRGCSNNPNCAAVYAYDGPEMPLNRDTNRPWVECSYIPKGNVKLLYDRYGSMTRFNPNNRNVFVSKKNAGDAFNPNIGTRVV